MDLSCQGKTFQREHLRTAFCRHSGLGRLPAKKVLCSDLGTLHVCLLDHVRLLSSEQHSPQGLELGRSKDPVEGERQPGAVRKVSGKRPRTSKEPHSPARCGPANGDTSVIPEPNRSRPVPSPSKRDFLEKQRKSKEIVKPFHLLARDRQEMNLLEGGPGDDVRQWAAGEGLAELGRNCANSGKAGNSLTDAERILQLFY